MYSQQLALHTELRKQPIELVKIIELNLDPSLCSLLVGFEYHPRPKMLTQ